LQLDHRLDTEYVWQMQRREENERTQISFQTLRLPRPICVEYPRSTESLRIDLEPLGGVLVAEAESIILGYTHVALTKSDRSAWVRNLVVDVPVRRHRIGHLLLDGARQWAVMHHANHITLETTTRSYPAIRFMLSQGLMFCGFNDRYYSSQDIAIFFGQNI
ncbi:MAG TPA: GNAT family N-acetyltransferase, partial [Aggregatilineales bacterium]|nr:GNAT family N-acetyltransferase [Aggregatilineales bacterium]